MTFFTPAVINGLISGGGALIGGGFSAFAGSKSNKTNKKMAREGWDRSELEAARVRQYNLDMIREARGFDRQQADKAFYRTIGQEQKVFERGRKYMQIDRANDRAHEQYLYQRGVDYEAGIWNRNVADEAAKWNRSVAHEASIYNRSRADEQRIFERTRAETLAAEQRGRDYAAQDLADHRAYNDPAAVRARLEAAGINPLVGVDNSGSFVGGAGALAPVGGSITGGMTPQAGYTDGGPYPSGDLVTSAHIGGEVAQAIAATSGVALATPNQYNAASVSPVDIGPAVASAFGAFADARMAEAELALRETQIKMEDARLREVMNRASVRPVVRYQRPYTGEDKTHVESINRASQAVSGDYGYSQSDGAALVGARAVQGPDGKVHTVGGQREPYMAFGTDIFPDPDYSPMQVVEDELGDGGVTWLAGADKLIADMSHTFRYKYWEDDGWKGSLTRTFITESKPQRNLDPKRPAVRPGPKRSRINKPLRNPHPLHNTGF